MYDIISLGDATLDTFVQLEEATVNCMINRAACQFCFNYADKIPLQSWQTAVGGNAANNAVGVSRLGKRAAIWTILGQDPAGDEVFATLRRERVAAAFVKRDRTAPTNQAFVINFQGERTILVHHNPRRYVLPPLLAGRWLYLTSMGEGSEKIFPSLLKYLKNNQVKLAFNPGTFQLKLGAQGLKVVLGRTDTLFLNVEEGARLLNRPAEREAHVITQGLQKLGAKIVVLTNGPVGAHAALANDCWQMPIRQDAPVVERTGAGDSFASGFLAAILHGETVPEALRWGTLNAASVIGKIGPQAGLLTLREMKNQLAKYKTLAAQAC